MSWRAVPPCAAFIATLLAVPAVSSAAVPRTGNTFSPRNGAELLEAATAIRNEGATAAFQATVQLSATTYEVSSTVDLTTVAPVKVIGPSSGGRAVVSNPSTGTPFQLLRVGSQQNPTAAGISNVDFTLKGSPTNSLVTVDLQRGSMLTDSTVTVPTTAASVIGVRVSPSQGTGSVVSPAILQRVTVNSGSTAGAAVRAANGAQVLSSTISGGLPALEVLGDGAITDHGTVLVDASRITGARTPVVRVGGGANRLRALLWSSIVDGSAGTASQLVNISGPTAATGVVEADLGQLTLRGPGAGAGVWVRGGVGTATLRVRAQGLLSTGSELAAIDCDGTANATTDVTVVGVYREALANRVAANCRLLETDLRTGPLTWRDQANGDLRPAWNSTLIDGVSSGGIPAPAGVRDVDGRPRFVPVSNTAAPGDIGALEYQVTPPQNVTASGMALGNRGLVALVGEGTDPDELEQPNLVFRWTLPDGLEEEGEVLLHRFDTSEPQTVQLEVIDVTGVKVTRSLTVTPAIRLDEPATDRNPDGVGPVVPGDPTDPADGSVPPSDTWVPEEWAPAEMLPRPAIDPGLKQVYEPIIKKVTGKTRRITTNRKSQPKFAAARKGEAAFVIDTYRKSEMALEIYPVIEGRGLTVGLPVVKYDLTPFKGRKVLRIGAKVGKVKLKPGLYQMSIAAWPRPGAVPERVSHFVRVLRAR